MCNLLSFLKLPNLVEKLQSSLLKLVLRFFQGILCKVEITLFCNKVLHIPET